MLGIFSNPDTKNKGFTDDKEFCEDCGKETLHSYNVDGATCKACGSAKKVTPVRVLEATPTTPESTPVNTE